MNEDEMMVGLDDLTDIELVDLYKKILEHIKFLDDSILKVEEGNSDE